MNKINPSLAPKEKNYKDAVISCALIAALFILLFALEHVLPANHMLFTVLKKGAIYALVAVSMNLSLIHIWPGTAMEVSLWTNRKPGFCWKRWRPVS